MFSVAWPVPRTLFSAEFVLPKYLGVAGGLSRVTLGSYRCHAAPPILGHTCTLCVPVVGDTHRSRIVLSVEYRAGPTADPVVGHDVHPAGLGQA